MSARSCTEWFRRCGINGEAMKNGLNDDFLQRLRAEPSKKFLSTLKSNLDRQAINHATARRTLFRTAILAALIGGSAVAVALAVWRGSSRSAEAVAPITAIGPQDSAASFTGAQRIDAARTVAIPARGGIPASAAAAETTAAQEQSRGTFVIAGPTAIILNGQDISRRWSIAGAKPQPEFTLTSSTEAIAMLCRSHVGAAAGSADIAGASRRILASELEHCRSNGVTHVAELQSGYESVVLARSGLYGAPKLSARDIFLALAAEVPDPNRPQSLIKNPYRTWSAVDGALLEEKIEVLGPPLSSATAAAFRQTLMEAGCTTFPWLAALKLSDTKRYEKICRTLRDDGVYQEKVEKLQEHLDTYPNSLALLDFRQVVGRWSTFAMASVDGVVPGIDTIVAETYPGSRAMFMYVNTARNHYGILAFVYEYRRSLAESASIPTLVAPQRQVDMRGYMAPLQEMNF
jgi:phosphate transport system substrate-binding protein